ncbi:MAG: hypothetical protein GQ574_23555 [Crocinitomix sp.]|nr:hypothetical protein [Crocinitomix sp.]
MSRFKQHISIVLIALMLIGMVWQSFTLVHFYMNRAEIAEAYCVNKDKPDLNCNGQCHLKKQLEAAIPDQEESTTTQPSQTSILLFVFAETHQVASCDCPVHEEKQYPDGLNETKDFVSEIYHPPQAT